MAAEAGRWRDPVAAPVRVMACYSRDVTGSDVIVVTQGIVATYVVFFILHLLDAGIRIL